jgi:outer membrane receptor protein involved in Fe transport
VERVGGYRDHSDARNAGARASWSTASGGDARVGLTLAGHDRDFDEPGPLIDALMNADHRASDPLFRFDQTRDRDLTFGVDATKRLSGAVQFSGSLSGQLRRTNGVRTLALVPGFGDSKERLASNRRWSAATQLVLGEPRLSRSGRLSVGAELSHGRLGSKYYDVVTGDRDAYFESDGARGDLSADAIATRLATALFAHYALAPHDRVRLSLGLRGDWLRDSFDPRRPVREGTRTRNSSVSPSAGLNVAYLQNRSVTGNVYVTASRSFKAATLDQLFDQRSIPTPFPPFSVTVSNSLLRPQHGVNVEVGTYLVSSTGEPVRFELNLSAYNVDMKDELDFDVESFRYVNISRSRHRGIEAGATVTLRNGASAFASLSMQSAISRSGEFAGRYLKAIPRQSSTAGVSLPLLPGLEVAGMFTSASGMYLDDGNENSIPSHVRIDLQLGYRLGDARLFLSARNVLDERYNSSGFPDPAGTGEPYWYPASGRVLQAGLRSGW